MIDSDEFEGPDPFAFDESAAPAFGSMDKGGVNAADEATRFSGGINTPAKEEIIFCFLELLLPLEPFIPLGLGDGLEGLMPLLPPIPLLLPPLPPDLLPLPPDLLPLLAEGANVGLRGADGGA